jgi:hypothetical protein
MALVPVSRRKSRHSPTRLSWMLRASRGSHSAQTGSGSVKRKEKPLTAAGSVWYISKIADEFRKITEQWAKIAVAYADLAEREIRLAERELTIRQQERGG